MRLVHQFAKLVDEESDAERFEYYRVDIHATAKFVLPHCEPETADRLAAIVATRFPETGSTDSTSAQRFQERKPN